MKNIIFYVINIIIFIIMNIINQIITKKIILNIEKNHRFDLKG